MESVIFADSKTTAKTIGKRISLSPRPPPTFEFLSHLSSVNPTALKRWRLLDYGHKISPADYMYCMHVSIVNKLCCIGSCSNNNTRKTRGRLERFMLKSLERRVRERMRTPLAVTYSARQVSLPSKHYEAKQTMCYMLTTTWSRQGRVTSVEDLAPKVFNFSVSSLSFVPLWMHFNQRAR